ncbi:hypothetical protein WJX77_010553 [Trebouxia sp. C0004]
MIKQEQTRSQHRFCSVEFCIYYVAIAAAAWRFVWRGWHLSSQVSVAAGHDHHWQYRLQPGWLFGLTQDLSDIQWRVFREGLPYAAGAMLVFTMLSRVVQYVGPKARAWYCFAFGFCFIGILHQASIVFPLTLTLANFCMADSKKPWLSRPTAIWMGNCAALLMTRMIHGGTFGNISTSLTFLDAYQGPLQWQTSYNLVALRHISFAVDKHWSSNQLAVREPVRAQLDTLKARQKASLPASAYNLITYLAYVYYPPLYIAGPICTFNSFASQFRVPMRLQHKYVFWYAGRLACAMLLLETMSHSLYFNSIAKHRLWQRYGAQLRLSAADMGMISFWVLMFMWLKFLVIWRFFRMWALLDGIQVPENMLRCICNNYDIEGFWKGWHASYNQWLVRYMYIPLGGSSTRLLNVWLIFTFVALWHDLEWRLIGWAWLTCVFFMPEMMLKKAAMQTCMAPMRAKWFYRHLCALAGCINMIVLMAVNLVGFVVGTDGILPFLQRCLLEPWFMLGTFVVCFSAVQIMFELRSLEQRRQAAIQPSSTRFHAVTHTART